MKSAEICRETPKQRHLAQFSLFFLAGFVTSLYHLKKCLKLQKQFHVEIVEHRLR